MIENMLLVGLCLCFIFILISVIIDTLVVMRQYHRYTKNKKQDDLECYIRFTGYTDPVKFYMLHNHYDSAAPNVGILGDFDKFTKMTNLYIKDASKDAVIIKSKDKPIVRILEDNMETSYVFIQTSQDLIGKKFRKYL